MPACFLSEARFCDKIITCVCNMTVSGDVEAIDQRLRIIAPGPLRSVLIFLYGKKMIVLVEQVNSRFTNLK